MVVTIATGTIPPPLKGGLTIVLVCPSGGSAAYTGAADMIFGQLSDERIEVGIVVEVSTACWSLAA